MVERGQHGDGDHKTTCHPRSDTHHHRVIDSTSNSYVQTNCASGLPLSEIGASNESTSTTSCSSPRVCTRTWSTSTRSSVQLDHAW